MLAHSRPTPPHTLQASGLAKGPAQAHTLSVEMEKGKAPVSVKNDTLLILLQPLFVSSLVKIQHFTNIEG